MQRIILHWNAESYTPSRISLEHYHEIIDGDGNIVVGKFPISANRPGIRLVPGKYAAHTFHCNGGSIGLSVSCMKDAIENPFNPGKYPMKELQWQALIRRAAHWANFYNIRVDRKTILSHAEVQETLGIKQKQKWDFTRLPFRPGLKGASVIGDEFRRAVSKLA